MNKLLFMAGVRGEGPRHGLTAFDPNMEIFSMITLVEVIFDNIVLFDLTVFTDS